MKHSDAKLCLNIEISREPDGSVLLGQEGYVACTLAKLDMADIKIRHTPMSGGAVEAMLSATSGAKPLTPLDSTLYHCIFGKLMYAMVVTRPDLCFSVGFLGRYLSCPTTTHLSIAKYILRYLKGTPKVCLKYYGRSEQNLSLLLQGYGDINFTSSDTRHSTTGHVYTLGASPIVWSSHLQRLVATSTTEAEYISCFETAKDAIWLRNYVCKLGYPCGGPTPIHQDNLSCITLTRDDAHHSCTKHINIKYHFT